MVNSGAVRPTQPPQGSGICTGQNDGARPSIIASNSAWILTAAIASVGDGCYNGA